MSTKDEGWDGPLTAEEQAMIDAAWRIHRDAAPKSLLDGFGEATEKVVALRRERDELRAEVERLTRGWRVEIHAKALLSADVNRTGIDMRAWKIRAETAEAEVERLRAELRTCQETLTACLEVPL